MYTVRVKIITGATRIILSICMKYYMMLYDVLYAVLI